MKIRGNEPIAALWSIVVQIVATHLAGRALTSDWSANSFRIVLYENFFFKKVQSELSMQSMTKELFPWTTIINLFAYQSEVSALPAECNRGSYLHM